MTSFKVIPLTQGKFAKVDADSFDFLSPKKWRYQKCGSVGYAARTERAADGSRHCVLMHRLLMGVPDGYVVDHINGDPLDNRRSNLRIATVAQNAWRQRSSHKLPRGVSRCSKTGRYIARVMKDGVRYHLGTYGDVSAAQASYLSAAKVIYGEFAPDE